MIWNDETDQMLMRLFAEGNSLRQATRLMAAAGHDVTIGAVAGRRWRLTGHRPSGPVRMIRPRPIPPPLPKTPIFAVDGEGISYLQLTEFHCKAILDKRGEYGLSMCCGKPRVTVRGVRVPYCLDHYKAFTTKDYWKIAHNLISE